jgi:UPF0271 protein
VASVDLNADLGEGASYDAEILEVVTSASVACGFHAGSPHTMHETVEAAARRGVTVGAHPSYADRDNFGRSDRDVDPSRLTDEILYQVGALDAVARACSTRVRFVKPHGALYNRIAVDSVQALAVCEAIKVLGDVALLVAAGSQAESVARHLSIEVVPEVFADRAYLSDGTLAPRGRPGALVTDPRVAARNALSLVLERRISTVDDRTLEIEGASICVHGDSSNALETAREVRAALERAGVTLRSFASS